MGFFYDLILLTSNDIALCAKEWYNLVEVIEMKDDKLSDLSIQSTMSDNIILEKLPASITVFAEQSGSHLQGIAIDTERKYMYCSFTTCLIKADINGAVVGSVKGLVGHLGCIAYNHSDGKIYGSLEFKNDAIGKGILKNIGYTGEVKDGFYVVSFDANKINRMDMDAEKDDVMKSVFLNEVYNDYTAPGHNFGCSGIDGITFAPQITEKGASKYLYIAYGIYGDTTRDNNDYQVILQYDISAWDKYAKPLNQLNMHRCGPEKPNAKYFVYTGNTTYGIQNLEYDRFSDVMIAAVYKGKKEQFPNYPMFFIDCTKKPQTEILKGVGEKGLVLKLTDLGSGVCNCQICGSTFAYGSTGIASLGEGYFYIAEPLKIDGCYGGKIDLYKLDRENLTFVKVDTSI